MNTATITEEEYQAAKTNEERLELFKSKGLPMRDNGTMDTDNYTILQRKVVTYNYKWAPIGEIFVRAVEGPTSGNSD